MYTAQRSHLKMEHFVLFSVIRKHLGDATVDEAVDLEYDINAAISSAGDAEKPHDFRESNDQEPKEPAKEKAVVTQGDKEREVKYDDIFIASADGMLLFKVHLHQASESTLGQLCDDASNTVLIENKNAFQ